MHGRVFFEESGILSEFVRAQAAAGDEKDTPKRVSVFRAWPNFSISSATTDPPLYATSNPCQ